MKSRLYFALFPRKCAACGKVIDYRDDFCEDCQAALPYIVGERCEQCGAQKEHCSCAGHKHHYESIVAPFYYKGGAKHALIKLKDYPIYAEVLAKACDEVIKSCYASESFDCICAVPMSPKRRKEAGFNHSEALAREISRLSGIPFLDALRTVGSAKAQHALSYDMRAGNVRGLFDVAPDADVKGKHILLVDDIKTSGATLNECALMLKLHDAASVRAVVAAIGSAHTSEKGGSDDGFGN